VTESLFAADLSSSNVKAVALSRTPENVSENYDINSETACTTSAADHIDMLFPFFLFVIVGFRLLFG